MKKLLLLITISTSTASKTIGSQCEEINAPAQDWATCNDKCANYGRYWDKANRTWAYPYSGACEPSWSKNGNCLCKK